jgi:hypothetical protein
MEIFLVALLIVVYRLFGVVDFVVSYSAGSSVLAVKLVGFLACFVLELVDFYLDLVELY